jgi:hypothetical protein
MFVIRLINNHMIDTATRIGVGRYFFGGHLVKKLKREGYWVRGVDIKAHEFAPTQADEFRLLDLREPHNCWEALNLGADPSMRFTSWPPIWVGWALSTLPRRIENIRRHYAQQCRMFVIRLININMIDISPFA